MKQEKTDSMQIKNSAQSGVMKDFTRFPYWLYRDDPNWVPPLVSEEKLQFSRRRNPFLQENEAEFFVCYKAGRPRGRIAVFGNNSHNQLYPEDNAAFFGFFESVEDDAVADALFAEASRWATGRGARILRGPTNFTINDPSGLLVDGFDDPPYFMMTYNPSYYSKVLDRNGYKTSMRFFAYEVSRETLRFPGFVDRLEKRLTDNNIIVRGADFKHLEREVHAVATVFNNSWNENWGFIPMKEEDLLEAFRKVKSFACEDMILFAEHEGKTVAFAVALPDVNQALLPLNGRLLPFNWIKLMKNLKKIKRIRVLLMGVLKEYRTKGIDLMLYKHILDSAIKHDFYTAELSWILENNRMMNRVLEHINAEVRKVYGVYDKELQPPD